jgi:hypothetical protein
MGLRDRLYRQGMTEDAAEIGVEEWRPVVGYAGRYEVSNRGRVRAVHVLCLFPTSRGYPTFSAYSPDRPSKRVAVHRAVLSAFVGPGAPGLYARHLNGDREDNRLENLAWGTPSDNTEDARGHGTLPVGEANGNSRTTELDVVHMRQLHAAGLSRSEIAVMYGLSGSGVADVLHGRTWKHVA